jgi:hypothetical protein
MMRVESLRWCGIEKRTRFFADKESGNYAALVAGLFRDKGFVLVRREQ